MPSNFWIRVSEEEALEAGLAVEDPPEPGVRRRFESELARELYKNRRDALDRVSLAGDLALFFPHAILRVGTDGTIAARSFESEDAAWSAWGIVLASTTRGEADEAAYA